MKILKRILPNGKKAECPQCGEPMRAEDELCEDCSRLPIIDEIFVLYSDGRMVDHVSRTLNPDMERDRDIRSSMIVALQNYIDGSMANEIGTFKDLKFGDMSMVIVPGNYLFVAVKLERGDPSDLRDRVSRALGHVEDEHRSRLDGWDGDKGKLEDMAKDLRNLLLA